MCTSIDLHIHSRYSEDGEYSPAVIADMCQALAARGYWPESWTGELIAEALLGKEELRDHPLLQPYLHGDRRDNPYVNFYWDYCAQGKPCHAPMTYPDMGEVIGLIHRLACAQGKAI